MYAVLSRIGGYLADRYSRRHVIAGSLLIWSAVTWATGHVTTYEQLLATRAVMGISEAFYIPAALALIADFHLGPTRSRAVGFHQMGIYAGVIVGILYALPLFFLLRNPARPANQVEVSRTSPVSALRELLGNGSFTLLVLFFTLPALADGSYAIGCRPFSRNSSGSGRGKLASPRRSTGKSLPFSARFWAVGWPTAGCEPTSVAAFTSVPSVCRSSCRAMFGVGYAPQTGQLWVAVAFLILFGLGRGFFDCNNMPILCQIARPELRATGYGIMNLVIISCGGIADGGAFSGIDRFLCLPSSAFLRVQQ